MPSDDRDVLSNRPPTLLALPSYLVGNVAMAGNRALVGILKAEELRLPQFAVLVALSDFGELAPHELSSRLGMDRSHVSTHVESLLKRGLVVREPHEIDRRRVTVALTSEGCDLVGSLAAAAAASEQGFLSSLSADEQVTLRALLMKVLSAEETVSDDQTADDQAADDQTPVVAR